jgi:hypothetical protein
MSQLVHQHQLGMARQSAIEIELPDLDASVVDLLMLWALLLTWREGGLRQLSRTHRGFVLGGLGVALLASATATLAMAGGVDAAAGLRGIVTFARIPTLLFIVFALRMHLRTGALLSVSVAGGLLSLLANGIYTSGTEGLTRFTAATFGRNGFSMALVACALSAPAPASGRGTAEGRMAGLRSGTMLALVTAASSRRLPPGPWRCWRWWAPWCWRCS